MDDTDARFFQNPGANQNHPKKYPPKYFFDFFYRNQKNMLKTNQ